MTNVVVCQQRNKTTHKVLVGEGPDNPMLRGVDTWHHTKGCLIPVLQGKHGSYIAA